MFPPVKTADNKTKTEQKQKLKYLILHILSKTGPLAKTRLAKLVLFAEIEYFDKTGVSLTGLYFVRLKNGPVAAFYDEVLAENTGLLWEMSTELIPIREEGRNKEQYVYSALKEYALPDVERKHIERALKKYAGMSGTKLSVLSHELPAWKYSEPNEPIYTAELAVKGEKEYFTLMDIVEDTDGREDELLAEKISSALLRE